MEHRYQILVFYIVYFEWTGGSFDEGSSDGDSVDLEGIDADGILRRWKTSIFFFR